MKALSLYIHIPFCQHKCLYCDFYSIEDKSQEKIYIEALKTSLRYHALSFKQTHQIETIYFGGGTPNFLTPSQLEIILNEINKHFTLCDEPEITIEINPEFSYDKSSLLALKHIGFNRVSIGIQSLDDNELKMLERIHDSQHAVECLANARKIFDNISIDLIYALPGQSIATLDKNLLSILDYKPEHISAYNLTVEEATPLSELVDSGEIIPADEDSEIEHFYRVHDMLSYHGYEHYEISNYAKSGKRSRHNSSYWTEQDYLGIGPSAHSRIANERFAYKNDLHAFIDDPKAFHEKDVVTEADVLITRLRCSEGLKKTDISPETWDKLLKYDRKHPDRFMRDENSIKCTLQGWLMLDTILLDLI